MTLGAFRKPLIVVGPLLIFVLLASLLHPAQVFAAPTISLDSVFGPAGTGVTVQGSGWPVGDQIGVQWQDGRSIGGSIGSVSGTGNFAGYFYVPQDAAPGTYTVVFQATQNPSITAQVSFRVTIPTITLQPSSGPSGTAVTATGNGWPDGKDIEFSWDVNDFLGSASADAAGNVTFSFNVPTNASVGTHVVLVNFTNGDIPVEVQVNFTVTTAASQADLSVTQTASPDPVAWGQALDYRITVTNNGPSNASNVTIVDTLPSNVLFTSAITGQWNCTGPDGSTPGGTMTCTRPSLPNGANDTILITVSPPNASGTLTNRATVSANESDPNAANNTANAVTRLVTYSISGRVTSVTGSAISGATVSVSGQATASTTTGSNGNYTLSNLVVGTYSISASKSGYTSPSPQTVTVPPNATNVNFTLQQQQQPSTISGQVLDINHSPLSAVTISDGAGHTVTTNISGTYTLNNMTAGTYTLTPSKSGYTFNPSSLPVTVPPNASGRNFTGTPSSSPGLLVLAEPLSLRSVGSATWPPELGDKLIAHIKVRNVGDQSLHIEHIGVRGRRNGNEFWDIGFWTVDIGGHQEWTLDPNNERPLQEGTYSFWITYQIGGTWTELGDPMQFTVVQPQPGHDAATLVNQSGPTITQPGTSVFVWAELLNNGTTTWRDSDNYGLFSVSNPYGAQPQMQIGPDIPPGQSRRWRFALNEPIASGHSIWQLRHNGSPFGPLITFELEVTPNDGTGKPPSLKLVSGIQLSPVAPSLNETVEARYVVHNTTSQPITVPYVGIAGRSPNGDAQSSDAHFEWLQSVSIPPNSDYTVVVHQVFSVAGPYAFYPALQMTDHDPDYYIITPEGPNAEPWLSLYRQWRVYVNITDSPASPLAECKVSWGFAQAQAPWRNKASDALTVRCDNIQYDPDTDIMTVDLSIENKLQTVLERHFEVSGGVVDPYNALSDNTNKFLFPSQPWPVLPWYKPSYQVIKRVMIPRGGVIHLTVSRNLNSPSPSYLVASGLDLAALVGLDSHIPNSESDYEDSLRDLLVDITNKIIDTSGGLSLINDGFGAITKPENTTADPLGTLKKVTDVIHEFETSKLLADKIPSYYVKAATPGADGLSLTQLNKRIRSAFGNPITNVRLTRLFYDIMTSPTQAEVTISASTKRGGGGGAWSAPQTSLQRSLNRANASADTILGNAILDVSGELAPGNERYRLIDGDPTTGWTAPISPDTKAWSTVCLAHSGVVLLSNIQINPGPTPGYPSAAALKNFHIDVSLDNITYHPLLKGSFSASELGNSKVWSINPAVPAKYVRLIIDSNQDSVSVPLVNIADMQMSGTIESLDDSFEPDNQPLGSSWIQTNGTWQGHNFSYANDEDWLRFHASAGGRYDIITSNLGPNVDTVLELYDQNGTTLLVSDDNGGGGLAARLLWKAPRDGTYYLRVRNLKPNSSGDSATYNIAVSGSIKAYLPLVHR